MGSGGSRSAPGSLDSWAWDPNLQISILAVVIFAFTFYTTGNILIALLIVMLVILPVPLIVLRYPKLQRRLLFHSWYYTAEYTLSKPHLFGVRYEAVNKVVNGTLGCWYIRGTNDKVVIYCHGSSGSRGNCYRVDLVNFLASIGCTVYSFDYRGYGDSVGESSEVNMIEDTESIIALARRKHPNKEIILYGHSLGTGVACLTADKLKSEGNPIDKIILEAAFLSIPDTLLDSPTVALLNCLPIYKNFIWGFSDLFCSKHVISNLDNVLFLFAKNDEVIKVHHVTTLHDMCCGSKLVLEEDGGHNFLIKRDRVKAAIKEHIGVTSATLAA